MAATAMRDEKSLSPAEKKIMKMGFAQGAKEIRKKVSAALGHLADPAWMTGGDLVAGAAGMAVDLAIFLLADAQARPGYHSDHGSSLQGGAPSRAPLLSGSSLR